MSSTRLNNDKAEYCQQQRDARLAEQFALYKYKCISNDSAFPCVGINTPMMTNGYNNDILSNKKFFNRPKSFIPEPLVVEKFQRPIGPFC
jgi:hypothetical protein